MVLEVNILGLEVKIKSKYGQKSQYFVNTCKHKNQYIFRVRSIVFLKFFNKYHILSKSAISEYKYFEQVAFKILK